VASIQGPALFLAQYMADEAPFDNLDTIVDWCKDLEYTGVQIPTWDPRCIDLAQAAESQGYCDDWKGRLEQKEMAVTELSTHLQGQLVAVHPAYDSMFDGFAADAVKGNPAARTEWAIEQVKQCLKASQRLGLTSMVTFSGALAWPYIYPWPQRPAGLVEEAFSELARRWKPILDYADECGVDCSYEIHPGEDLHDGASFERFVEAVGDHPRACINYDPSHFELMALDYVDFIDIYHDRIKSFHVKDAELVRSGRTGVYGGYLDWKDRSGRFRTPGEGAIDFSAIFTALTRHGFDGWAVVEWECPYEHSSVGAAKGAEFVNAHIIQVTESSFDDFAGGSDPAENRKILGLD
jgi:sugar phosphate isomerase/epimerase